VFEILNVRKAFPGVLALDNVSMALQAGEIHALVGENGAGKSTLIKIITGVYRPDGGRLVMDGAELHLGSPQDAITAGIGAVHQERNLIPRFSIAENIRLERLPVRHGLVDYQAIYRDAQQWLDLLNLKLDPATEVARLSPAQAQLVEIAKALSIRSRVLLLDEPTASITPDEADLLFTVLRQLRDQGVAMLYVSHKLEEILALCDRVTVLRDGKAVAANQPIDTLDRDRIVTQMVGRAHLIGALPLRTVDTAEVVLEACNLSTPLGHRNVSFSLHHKEILGFYGLVGAGRSEIARAIIGLDQISSGEVLVNGRHASIRGVRQANKKFHIGYVTENRKEEGLFLIHTVATNVAATVWDRLGTFLGLVSKRSEAELTRRYVKELDIKVASVRQLAGTLSGGNQQKVSLAKWLAAGAQILIVDEPTVGIDVKTKNAFHELIWGLATDGMSIILISSDMPEMVHLADRILVMRDMQLVGEVANTRDYDEVSRAIMQLIHAAGPDAGFEGTPPLSGRTSELTPTASSALLGSTARR
jgi:ribose transport system ATP-binding protein